MSPLGLLSCLDGSTVVDISAISARAAAWCFVLKCPYCVSWKLVLCGIGTLREEPRQDPLVILTEYGGSVMIRNFAYTRQSPVAHSQADCRARGGRETATQFYTDCPSWRAFKEPLTSTAIDTRLASRNTCEAGDSAGGLYTASCVRLPVSLCVSDPFVPRGLGVGSWCRFLVFLASGTRGSFPSRPRESTSPI